MKKILLLATALALMLSANTLNLNSEKNATSINTALDVSDYVTGFSEIPAIVGVAPAVPVMRPIGFYLPTARAGHGKITLIANSNISEPASYANVTTAGLNDSNGVANAREVARPWKQPSKAGARTELKPRCDSMTIGAGGNFRRAA